MKYILFLIFALTCLQAHASRGGYEILDNQFMRVGTLENGCKGILIFDDVILTAAHCTKNNPTRYMFYLDLYNPQRWTTSTADYIEIKKIKSHPKYNSRKRKTYDLSLVFLERAPSDSAYSWSKPPLGLSDNFKITEDDSKNRSHVLVSRFSGDDDFMPWIKSSIETKRVPRNGPVNIYYSQDRSVQICPGDSGAPIFFEDDGRLFLHGIVSGGIASLKYSWSIIGKTLPDAPGCDDVLNKYYVVPLYKHTAWINRVLAEEGYGPLQVAGE